MSNTEFTDKSEGVQLSFVSAFLKGYLAVEKHRRRRMADSHKLSDHTLKDIGRQRIDVSSAAVVAKVNGRR